MAKEGCVLFASDVHLRERSPEVAETFFSFLRGPAFRAGALYLLGDIFDLWIGDDDPSPLVAEFAAHVRTLSDMGVDVRFMAGNHDFLLGEEMAVRCGMKLLPDEAVLEHGRHKALLLHGDTLCTDDEPYMKWRAYAHDPGNIGRFLALPLEGRRREIDWLVQTNAGGTSAGKPVVSLEAVAHAAARRKCTLMIHGHTHERHERSLSSSWGEWRRMVLPAWTNGAGGYIRMDGNTVEFVDYSARK